MCPLPGASELLDRRHPNFRDFRSKAVLWQEKPSASLCKTPMNFRAAKLEGSILWRSLWLCDMLHIFHHVQETVPIEGSKAFQAWEEIQEDLQLEFSEQELYSIWHFIIVYDQTHMRAHTQAARLLSTCFSRLLSGCLPCVSKCLQIPCMGDVHSKRPLWIGLLFLHAD